MSLALLLFRGGGGTGAANYAVAAASGTYAITGQSATLARSRIVTANSGSYAITGQSASVLYGRLLTANSGSYAITGQAATLLRSKVLTATSGTYTIAGQTATLLHSRVLTAAAGSYTINGQAASLLHSRLITASNGTYAINGQTATITYTPATGAYQLVANAGSYTVAGQTASILHSSLLTADAGNYAISGQSATINYSGATPTPDQGQTPAGRRRRTVDIYRVRVDGQVFEFKTYEAAVAFLEQAKAFALAQAQALTRKATELTEPLPTLKKPVISFNTRELRAKAAETTREIEVIYRQALIDAEIAMIFALDKRADDDEDTILLLM